MTKARPFNSYGQIIEEGGGRAAAILLYQGKSYEDVASFLSSRYEGVDRGTISKVVFGARSATLAGRRLTQSIQATFKRMGEDIEAGRNLTGQKRIGTTLPLDDIPIEPDLFGDTPEGRRIDMTVEVEPPDGSGARRRDFELSGDETEEDITREIIDWIMEAQASDPNRFNTMSWGDITELAARVVQARRKY